MEFKKGLQFLYLLAIPFLFVSCDSSNSPPAFQDIGDTDSNACKARISTAYVQNITYELKSVRREAESYLHSISDEFLEFGGYTLIRMEITTF